MKTFNITTIYNAYIEAMLWSSGDDDCEMDSYSLTDITQNLEKSSNNDIEKFIEIAKEYLDDWSDEQIGHDFWLTRNGHGAGFWDRNLPFGDTLSELVGYGTQFLPIDVYINDDSLVDF